MKNELETLQWRVDDLRARLQALALLCESAVIDAMRYGWIKEQVALSAKREEPPEETGGGWDVSVVWWMDGGGGEAIHPDDLDEVIDQALDEAGKLGIEERLV